MFNSYCLLYFENNLTIVILNCRLGCVVAFFNISVDEEKWQVNIVIWHVNEIIINLVSQCRDSSRSIDSISKMCQHFPHSQTNKHLHLSVSLGLCVYRCTACVYFVYKFLLRLLLRLRPVSYISLNLLIVSSNLCDKKGSPAHVCLFRIQTNKHTLLMHSVLHLKNFSKFVRLENIRASHYICYGWKSGAHESPDHSNRKCITQRRQKGRNFAMAENGSTTTVWISYINRSCHLFFPCVCSLMLLHSPSKLLCFIMSNGIHLIPAFNRHVSILLLLLEPRNFFTIIIIVSIIIVFSSASVKDSQEQ